MGQFILERSFLAKNLKSLRPHRNLYESPGTKMNQRKMRKLLLLAIDHGLKIWSRLATAAAMLLSRRLRINSPRFQATLRCQIMIEVDLPKGSKVLWMLRPSRQSKILKTITQIGLLQPSRFRLRAFRRDKEAIFLSSTVATAKPSQLTTNEKSVAVEPHQV